jgi:hypothetical protein
MKEPPGLSHTLTDQRKLLPFAEDLLRNVSVPIPNVQSPAFEIDA